jgi:AcrR family transcriptional regulator
MSKKQETPKRKPRGRPRIESATSHEAIMDAVYELLQEKSLFDLTIEEIAKKAKVGKPTIYKWWPSKAALVLDMFQERIVGKLAVEEGKTAEEAIRTQVRELIRLLNGFFGKVAADIIAEGQCDSEVLKEYRERYVNHRRAVSGTIIKTAIANGEFKKEIDPELLIDMIYGPIYYRLLVRHQKLDEAFGKQIVDHLMKYLKS